MRRQTYAFVAIFAAVMSIGYELDGSDLSAVISRLSAVLAALLYIGTPSGRPDGGDQS